MTRCWRLLESPRIDLFCRLQHRLSQAPHLRLTGCTQSRPKVGLNKRPSSMSIKNQDAEQSTGASIAGTTSMLTHLGSRPCTGRLCGAGEASSTCHKLVSSPGALVEALLLSHAPLSIEILEIAGGRQTTKYKRTGPERWENYSPASSHIDCKLSL